MIFNIKIIFSFLGILLTMNGAFMWLCLPFSLYFEEGDWLSLFLSGAITIAAGAFLWYRYRNTETKDIQKRDGYLIVTMGWLAMSAFGALPYILSGEIPSYTDAFFETISGYSTTGASILTDVESVSKGILFWRSITQWIGGMGIIVLTVAILPILGIGGMQLFVAEAPGITPEKLKPRIQATAKRLWYVYAGLTGAEVIMLMIGEMSFYDAINHSLTTMATGGFSTKNSSTAEFTPYVQYVITFFMLAAGTSFTLNYFWLKADFKKIWENEEFRYYIGLTLFFTLVAAVSIYIVSGEGIESSFRKSFFMVTSLITTTGYVSADYTIWGPFLTILFFSMMFLGGSAGSTAGGVKIVRHIILVKNSFLELKRQLHPSAIIPVRLNSKAISQNITFNILAFIIIYVGIFAVSSVALTLTGVDFITSIGAVATSLGNVGPGLGSVGPVDNFAHLPAVSKWLLSFLMLTGRLELFTVLILFTPSFWRKF